MKNMKKIKFIIDFLKSSAYYKGKAIRNKLHILHFYHAFLFQISTDTLEDT